MILDTNIDLAENVYPKVLSHIRFKGNASSGNVNAGIALASQRPNPFVSDSEEESLASFVTEHLFTGPSGRTAAPGQSIEPDEAVSHESNVHDNTSKVNQVGKGQRNLPNLDPKQSLSFQRIPDRDLSTATQCSNKETTDNRDTRRLLVGDNRTGKQSRSHSSTIQTLSSNQSSVNSGKSVNTMAAPSVNLSRSTSPSLNAEIPSNSIEVQIVYLILIERKFIKIEYYSFPFFF